MRQDLVVGPIRDLVEERLAALFLDPDTLEWWVVPALPGIHESKEYWTSFCARVNYLLWNLPCEE